MGNSQDKYWDITTGTAGNSNQMYVSIKGYKSSKENMTNACKAFESLLSNYHNMLVDIRENVILSGAVADALSEYIIYVNSAKGVATTISKTYKKTVNSFLDRVDTDDDFLYNSTAEKDFTDNALEMFQEVTIHRKETGNWWNDHKNDAGRWLIQLILDVFGWDDLSDYEANMLITEEAMKELAKTESRRIDDIFSFIRDDDQTYAIRFNKLIEAEESFRNLLKGMMDVIANRNTFTADNIKCKLSQLYNDMVDNISTAVTISSYEIKTIEAFVKSNWASLYFSTFLKAITTFLSDLGTVEEVQMIIYNAFGISKGSVEYGNYEKYIIKEQLLDTFDDMANAYKYSESDEKAAVDSFHEFLGYVKEYEDDWYNWMNTHRIDRSTGEIVEATKNNSKFGPLILDGRTKEAKEFKKMLDGLGGAKKILEYGNEAIDYLSKLFVDYDKSQKIIQSFMANNNNDGTVKDCMQEIEGLYNKELDAWLQEGVQRLKNMGVEAATKTLERKIPVFLVIGKIRDTIDTVGEITGSGTRAKSMLNATIYTEIYYESERAYENALQKVKNAKISDEKYEQLIQDLQNCFDFCKKSLVNLMKEMANATQGSKKAYYQYCASVAQNASMSDEQQLKILSYDEYIMN